MRTVNIYKFAAVLLFFALFAVDPAFGQNPAFQVTSTTGGFNAPSMMQGQRLALTPVAGNLVWQTDFTTGYYFYNGTSWVMINDATALTGIIPVVNGGTGKNTLTSNGVLFGNGTSPVNLSAASTAANQVLSTPLSGGAPGFVSLGGGTCLYGSGIVYSGGYAQLQYGGAQTITYAPVICAGYVGEGAGQEIKMPKCVVTRIRVYIGSNTATTATTFNLRKNNANAGLSINIPATTIAEFINTGSIAFADGDMLSFNAVIGGSAANAFGVRFIEFTYYLLP